MWPPCNYSVQTKLWGFFFFLILIIYCSFFIIIVVFFFSFEFDVNVMERFSSLVELFEGLDPSGKRVKAGLLFIPFNGSQPSVPPVRRGLINTGSGGHLHVLHENIRLSTVATAGRRLSQWKDYRRASAEKCFQSARENTRQFCRRKAERVSDVGGMQEEISCFWAFGLLGLLVELLVTCRF